MEEESKKLEVSLPFSGFYETIWHNLVFDYLHAMQCECCDGYESCTTTEVDTSGYRELEIELCRQYTDLFAEALGIKLEFKEMWSPKEYNFKTDRIFAEISVDDARMLLDKADMEKLAELVKINHSSCPGFISFVEDNFAKWPVDAAEWNLNQLETLLEYSLNVKMPDSEQRMWHFYEEISLD